MEKTTPEKTAFGQGNGRRLLVDGGPNDARAIETESTFDENSAGFDRSFGGDDCRVDEFWGVENVYELFE